MKVIKEVAKSHKISEKEVREEMLKAIRVGRENPNPDVQAMWSKLFPDGREPTPEEFIKAVAYSVLTESDC